MGLRDSSPNLTTTEPSKENVLIDNEIALLQAEFRRPVLLPLIDITLQLFL
jgi:hypothetical protein